MSRYSPISMKNNPGSIIVLMVGISVTLVSCSSTSSTPMTTQVAPTVASVLNPAQPQTSLYFEDPTQPLNDNDALIAFALAQGITDPPIILNFVTQAIDSLPLTLEDIGFDPLALADLDADGTPGTPADAAAVFAVTQLRPTQTEITPTSVENYCREELNLVCTIDPDRLLLEPSCELPDPGPGVVGTGTPESCTEAALLTAIAQGGEIQFNCGCDLHTITVTDDLLITQDTSIDGGGPNQGGRITISGGNSTRVLRTNNSLSLTLQNLTIQDGRESGADSAGGGLQAGNFTTITIVNSRFEHHDGTSGNQEQGGGAIFVASGSSLTIQDSHFRDNRGVNGGAINNLLSELLIEDSTFINNTALEYGGAIYTDGANASGAGGSPGPEGGTIEILRSRIEGNSGSGQGGGLFLFAYHPDEIRISDSTIIRNQVSKDDRGDALGGGLRVGIARDPVVGQLIIENTMVAENLARSQGGGLWLGEQTATQIHNSSFVRNDAVETGSRPDGEGGLGGAIMFAMSESVMILNSTFSENFAGFVGGATFGGFPDLSQDPNAPPYVTVGNSIFADNDANNSDNPWSIELTISGQEFPPGSGQYRGFSEGGNNFQFPDPTIFRNSNPPQVNPDPKNITVTAGTMILDPQLGSFVDHGTAIQTPLTIGDPTVQASGAGAR